MVPDTLVAFDNFFTGIPLMRDLYDKQIYSYGTVRLNRKGLPESATTAKKKKEKKLKKHEFTFASQGHVSLVQWMDSQVVSVLSTAHDPKSASTVKRTQKDGIRIIPTAISEYTLNMCGVDRFDHYRSSYPHGRKSRRNWLRLFYFMFDSSIINSFLTYMLILLIHKQTNTSHRDFRLRLARALVDGYSNRKRTANITFKNKKGGNLGVPEEIRLSTVVQHYPEDQSSYTRCRFCSTKKEQKRTKVVCDVCYIALCATPCFKFFHKASE